MEKLKCNIFKCRFKAYNKNEKKKTIQKRYPRKKKTVKKSYYKFTEALIAISTAKVYYSRK